MPVDTELRDVAITHVSERSDHVLLVLCDRLEKKLDAVAAEQEPRVAPIKFALSDTPSRN